MRMKVLETPFFFLSFPSSLPSLESSLSFLSPAPSLSPDLASWSEPGFFSSSSEDFPSSVPFFRRS